MKKLIFLLLFVSTSLFANPTVFGLTISETTAEQLKGIYNVSHAGINKYSNGSMYLIPRDQIKFDGIGDVTAIFSSDDTLVAVLSDLPKSKFNYLNEVLGKKYQLIKKTIPFVGDKSATYKSGDTDIILNAPHMGFELSMNYIHADLLKAFNSQSEREKKEKQQKEESML